MPKQAECRLARGDRNVSSLDKILTQIWSSLEEQKPQRLNKRAEFIRGYNEMRSQSSYQGVWELALLMWSEEEYVKHKQRIGEALRLRREQEIKAREQIGGACISKGGFRRRRVGRSQTERTKEMLRRVIE